MGLKRFLAVAVALGLLGATLPIAAVGAQTATKVKITIRHDSSIPDFDGFLYTSFKCGSGTKVTVYKQNGSSPRPSQDKNIGSGIAQPNGGGYQWFVHTKQNEGIFYAHTSAKSGCKAGFSKSITLH
jgi:hypothetical protein